MIINRKEPVMLVLGDVIILGVSLLLTLWLRYGEALTYRFAYSHILPFAIIFIYSLIFFYISGLYGRTIALERSSVPWVIIKTQLVNGMLAVLLFYFIPTFSVTPKITLSIYIGLSIAVLILWRLSVYHIFSLQKKSPSIVIGEGAEVDELIKEMNINPRLGVYCFEHISSDRLNSDYIKNINTGDLDYTYVLADMSNPKIDSILPEFYRKFFPKIKIIDIYDLYENVFNRIPLSCMNYAWIMSHVSSMSSSFYYFIKRLIDITLSIIVIMATAILYPFVALAIKLDDHGPIFISQERIGKNGLVYKIYKFRTMQRSDSGKWLNGSDNKVTRVGYFLRKTRIDELPQALTVLKGDMSLIGPRADIIDLGKRLEQEIPYYSIRTVITPGLSGWAQVNQNKPPQSVEETKLRLSYDLYYIKHRSLSLDMAIILKTIRTLLSREGM
jgi:exopolysaccharide biosynthesis polyprenyl glycosylphosphotransferase